MSQSCFIDPIWLFSKEQVVDARTLIGVMSDQSNKLALNKLLAVRCVCIIWGLFNVVAWVIGLLIAHHTNCMYPQGGSCTAMPSLIKVEETGQKEQSDME